MKVVINKCYGGFGLSAKAVARFAELKGRPCFFFKQDPGNLHGGYIPITIEEADSQDCFMFSAFDIPNPDEVLPSQKNWSAMSMEARQASNAAWEAHSHDTRPSPRHDADLVRVVEELGDTANGRCAELKVVEVPDGVEYEIDEYDGAERVAERHRTWA